MKRDEILETAAKIVTGVRNKQYGEPEDNFAVIAEYWSTYLSQHNGGRVILLTPMDVAIMMALFKIGRITTAGEFTADSYVDCAGYVACAGEIATDMATDMEID